MMFIDFIELSEETFQQEREDLRVIKEYAEMMIKVHPTNPTIMLSAIQALEGVAPCFHPVPHTEPLSSPKLSQGNR